MFDPLRRMFSDVDLATRTGKVAAVTVLLGFIALIGVAIYLFAHGIDGGWAF